MLKARNLISLVGIPVVALVVACGGGDDGNGDSSGSPTGSGNATAPAATTSPGSSGSGGNVSDSNIQACQLLTRDEVSMAFGEQVGEGMTGGGTQNVEAGITLRVSTCRFSIRGGAFDIGFERLSGPGVGQIRPGIRPQFEQSCPQAQRVAGIGDVACSGDRLSFRFLRDTTSVLLTVFQEITAPDRTEALRTLAQRAASRLQ